MHQRNEEGENTKAHRTALPPWRVKQELAATDDRFLNRLIHNYKTAYLLGYTSGKVEIVGKQTGVSDPTGDTTAEREWVRNTVAFAAEKIREAAKALEAADNAIGRVTGSLRTYESVRHRAGEIAPEESQTKAKKHLHAVTKRTRNP